DRHEEFIPQRTPCGELFHGKSEAGRNHIRSCAVAQSEVGWQERLLAGISQKRCGSSQADVGACGNVAQGKVVYDLHHVALVLIGCQKILWKVIVGLSVVFFCSATVLLVVLHYDDVPSQTAGCPVTWIAPVVSVLDPDQAGWVPEAFYGVGRVCPVGLGGMKLCASDRNRGCGVGRRGQGESNRGAPLSRRLRRQTKGPK